MFPIGVQVYSVREHAEKDFFGTLGKIKEMGYDGVEFAGLYGKSPSEVKAVCGDLGLVPVSAHVAIDEMLKNPDAVFDGYSEIGCEYIAIPYLTEDDRPGGKNFSEIIENIISLSKKAKTFGLTMLYHNHDFEFKKLGGVYGLDILYGAVPPELLQTELDTCWVNVGGEDPAAYLVKYSGRAPVVHLKDFVMKNKSVKEGLYGLIGVNDVSPQAEEGDFAFRPVGYGVQDNLAILRAAREAGTKWLIVEQDRPCLGWDSLDCIGMSMAYLRKINK
ncbi:MAG: sugar phosphate isomerase/epimerase [Eubacteriales bacterium]